MRERRRLGSTRLLAASRSAEIHKRAPLRWHSRKRLLVGRGEGAHPPTRGAWIMEGAPLFPSRSSTGVPKASVVSNTLPFVLLRL